MKVLKEHTNQEVAELLRSVAAALEVKGANRFRIVAYEKAADSIEHATSEVKDLWEEGNLQKLPGVGGSLTQHLDELFRTGTAKHFEEELHGLPEGMFVLLQVPGIGPKNALKLSLKMGLTHAHSALSKLEKAAKQGEIRTIEGFGADSEARILAGIEEFNHRESRLLIHHADKIANEIIAYMEKLTEVKAIYPLGSLRRRVATVGDLDFAACTDHPQAVLKHFTEYPKAKRIVEAGTVSATIMLAEGHHIDLLVQNQASFGSLLQHFTGSKHHNIALREYALKHGWSLSEKGIKLTRKVKSSKLKVQNYNSKLKIYEFSTEEKFYEALGMTWISPELREDSGEIEAALKGKLPDLVGLKDIKGDFHVHSDFPIEPSHDLGLNSMEEMVKKAQELNYEYLALSEHNPAVAGHSTQQIIDLVKRKYELVIKLNEKYEKGERPVKILNSLEIDIQPNGGLALPEKAFEFLDLAIVSIHGSFRQAKKEATQRVLKALEHPKVKILGHPTGRMLNHREGLDYDWEKVFEFCLKNNKWLEIDGWPDRLDLPDTLVREAIKAGVKLTVDSDAHQVDHMTMLQYGVSVAGRGWAEGKDVINTLSWKELQKIL